MLLVRLQPGLPWGVKIDNIYEKMKNYNPASDTSTPEIFKPKPNWNQPMTMWHGGF